MAQKILLSGDWLRRQRKALDLTQNSLAQRAGDTRVAFATAEIAERCPPHQLAERPAARVAIVGAERGTFVNARHTPHMPLLGCCSLREVQHPC